MPVTHGYTLLDEDDEEWNEENGEAALPPTGSQAAEVPNHVHGEAPVLGLETTAVVHTGLAGLPMPVGPLSKPMELGGWNGVGGPGWSNWTPEMEIAKNIDASRRLTVEKLLAEAVVARDALRCAVSLVEAQALGLDISTQTAELAAAIADPELLATLREARDKHELELELQHLQATAEAGLLAAPASANEQECTPEDISDEQQSEMASEALPSASVGDAAALDVGVPLQHDIKQALVQERKEEKQRKRRPSLSLAERLLLGPNTQRPASSEEEEQEEPEQQESDSTSREPVATETTADPDLQLVGIWHFGKAPFEHFRVSRPERGLLLIDRQLPTGQRASGALRRGPEAGVLCAEMITRDAKSSGFVRVRMVDATHMVLGLSHSKELGWYQDITADKATSWCCCPPEKRPIGIRGAAEFDAARTGAVLRPGEAFCVSEERAATGGVLWLRLADGRGWVFDRQPGGDALCARHELPIGAFAVLDGYLHPETGELIHHERLTLQEAKIRCAALPDCCGFCYEGGPAPESPVETFFKNRWHHCGSGEQTGWTSCRVERGPPRGSGGTEEMATLPASAAEEEEARQWYESISKGWLTRHKPEGANEGGLNALEDILASMDRKQVAEDPELEAVRTGLASVSTEVCTALSPLTREDATLVPTGKLTSSLRPYSAKEGDDTTEPNEAAARLTGQRWVTEFRRHHPAARVSPGLALCALTGGEVESELPRPSRSALRTHKDDDNADAESASDSRGREALWWEERDVEVTDAPSLEDRAMLVAPPRPKARPKERTRMAMPKVRPLPCAMSSSQPRLRRGPSWQPNATSDTSAELGADLSGLFK